MISKNIGLLNTIVLNFNLFFLISLFYNIAAFHCNTLLSEYGSSLIEVFLSDHVLSANVIVLSLLP